MEQTQTVVEKIVRDFAQEQGLEIEAGSRPGELVVVLPGDQKLRTVCSLVIGTSDLSLSAFVIRHPDENEAGFFRNLLRRNLRMPGLAYAVDVHDDVYVVGRLPLAAVDGQSIDRLFGVVLEAADGAFNDLLLAGFRTSMRKEWAWRVDRGESLRNLEAFRDALTEGKDGGPVPFSEGPNKLGS
ncbi:YbjN domain-containing protein [Austwickia chelonae]|uniref:YbjN domain-containing protein n=1 Tax=Austwickia chelonae TaxID=100225 RepID=UPI000E23A2B1|nr:YbjN domain-containing protein [Austwickia chelonae]